MKLIVRALSIVLLLSGVSKITAFQDRMLIRLKSQSGTVYRVDPFQPSLSSEDKQVLEYVGCGGAKRVVDEIDKKFTPIAFSMRNAVLFRYIMLCSGETKDNVEHCEKLRAQLELARLYEEGMPILRQAIDKELAAMQKELPAEYKGTYASVLVEFAIPEVSESVSEVEGEHSDNASSDSGSSAGE